MYFYAQINDSGTVISVTQSHSAILSGNMAQIAQYDVSLLGTTYQNGVFTRQVASVDDVRTTKLIEISEARDSAIYTSVTSSALGTPKTYNYSRDAAENFRDEALDLLVDTSITSVDWYVIEDAAFVTHTRDQFNQVLKDVSAHETPLKMRYFTLEAQVNAATTVDAVNAVVW